MFHSGESSNRVDSALYFQKILTLFLETCSGYYEQHCEHTNAIHGQSDETSTAGFHDDKYGAEYFSKHLLVIS